MPKKTIEEEINLFLLEWGYEKMQDFYRDLEPIYDLFKATEDYDWLEDAVGKENQQVIRMVRAVYLISHFAEFHAGRLCITNIKFKNLWKRLEKEGIVETKFKGENNE